MKFNESREKAMTLAKDAFEALATNGLRPNPHAYAVWYCYASGAMPTLNEAVDKVQTAGKGLDDPAIEDIYLRFFGPDDDREELKSTSEKIEQTLEEVMKMVASANQGASDYGDVLESFEGGIASAKGAEELKSLVGNVLQETRTMVEFNQSMEDQLAQSTREINRLKEEMAAVRQEATTDGLTGLANRKAFDEAMIKYTDQAQEEGAFLCLVMTDIDHFKKFNDTYGHQLGDQVLKLVAHTIKETVRGGDFSARYGGEELAVILPNTNLREALNVAEEIRAAVAGKRIRNKSGDQDMGKVTLTLGVAEYSLGEPPEDMLKRADDGLYVGKRRGRNTVVSQNDLEDADA